MNLTVKSQADKLIIPLVVSTAVSLLLFYIDEGYYNFRWMLSMHNWAAFASYVAVLSSAQILVNFTLASITRTINASALFWLSGFLLASAVLFFLLGKF